MGTTVSGQDANVVQTQLKQALDAALAVARPAVQPGQLDVRTGNFSLYLTHDKNGKVNGWQGTTELVLNGRDFSRITATAGKIKSLTLANISFGLSREQRAKVEDEAQAIAIERFKAKALEVSKGFGFSAYTLREVRISGSGSCCERGPMAMPGSERFAAGLSPRFRAPRRDSFGMWMYTLAPKGMEVKIGLMPCESRYGEWWSGCPKTELML
jgi:predicted secreted protein